MSENTMKVLPILAIVLALISLSLPACNMHREEQPHEEHHKIVATSPQLKAVTLIQPYVCQIHSRRHIKVCALERGYLEAIPVREGQQVKEGDLLFKVIPILYQKKADAELAEAKLAQLEFDYTKKLYEDKVVSQNELALLQAKLAKAQAQAGLATAELNFATVKAPFDGIVDRLQQQQGSLVQEGEVLTTLSDNSVMWVYFNVPEANYLEYMADLNVHKKDLQIELVLANGHTFPQVGKLGAIEADFNNETGNISFRADFPNPDRLLRHGQTGTVLIRRVQNDAIVIPQRATFEVLQKRYVYVIDKDHVAHQREIVVQNELEDLFVIEKGVSVNDKIVLEGIRQVRDGEKVEYENRQPGQVTAQLKNHAE
jgi:membrane fusion protein (multidrug efflux system)